MKTTMKKHAVGGIMGFCLVTNAVLPVNQIVAASREEKVILTPKPGPRAQDQRPHGLWSPSGEAVHLSYSRDR